jgi:hypothetical protein
MEERVRHRDTAKRLYCWDINNSRQTNTTIDSILALPAVGDRLDKLRRLQSEAETSLDNNNVTFAKNSLEACVVCLIASYQEMTKFANDIVHNLLDCLQSLSWCYESLGLWGECIDACDYMLSLDSDNVQSLRARAKVRAE